VSAEARITLHAFALTQGGHPRHPLYLPYSAEPTPWRAGSHPRAGAAVAKRTRE